MYKVINKKTKAVHILNNEQYKKFFELKRATKQRKVTYEHIGDKYYTYNVSWFANNIEDYEIINTQDETINDIINICVGISCVLFAIAISKILMLWI